MTMLRDTGLHAALALGVATVIGAIAQHIAIGAAIGLLLAALVTARWPSVHVEPARDGNGDA